MYSIYKSAQNVLNTLCQKVMDLDYFLIKKSDASDRFWQELSSKAFKIFQE